MCVPKVSCAYLTHIVKCSALFHAGFEAGVPQVKCEHTRVHLPVVHHTQTPIMHTPPPLQDASHHIACAGVKRVDLEWSSGVVHMAGAYT